jgi:hypothetical protein
MWAPLLGDGRSIRHIVEPGSRGGVMETLTPTTRIIPPIPQAGVDERHCAAVSLENVDLIGESTGIFTVIEFLIDDVGDESRYGRMHLAGV